MTAAHKFGDPVKDEEAAVPLVARTGEESPRTTPAGSPEARSAATTLDHSSDWEDFCDHLAGEDACQHERTSTRASAQGIYRVCDDCDAYLGPK